MTAPIERPDWGEGTALVPTEDDAVQPAEATNAFANSEVERRYRGMVASRMAKASLPADEAKGVLASALVVEWDVSGGFEARLAQAQNSAIAVLGRLDPQSRVGFIADFDALPEDVRSTVFSEIALGSAGSVRNASDADVSRFASTSEGSTLVKEWGRRASRNVAIVRDRISRILGRMPAEDIDAAINWFDALPPASAAAIYRMLVEQS